MVLMDCDDMVSEASVMMFVAIAVLLVMMMMMMAMTDKKCMNNYLSYWIDESILCLSRIYYPFSLSSTKFSSSFSLSTPLPFHFFVFLFSFFCFYSYINIHMSCTTLALHANSHTLLVIFLPPPLDPTSLTYIYALVWWNKVPYMLLTIFYSCSLLKALVRKIDKY